MLTKIFIIILTCLKNIGNNFERIKEYYSKLENFHLEYLESKRIKKYNRVMQSVENFIDNQDLDEYTVTREYYEDPDDITLYMCHGDWNQLAISICIKKLSPDRIKSIWSKIFPSKDIDIILEDLEENCEWKHVIYGYDHDKNSPKVLQKYEYTEEDVKKLLEELSLSELANIIAEIREVTYKNCPGAHV